MVTHSRIASSDVAGILFGDTSRQKGILEKLSPLLTEMYGGKTSLPEQFQAIPSRIICICPMVLCEVLLSDLSLEAPDTLLGGLGLAMYSISTHDDVVDERPEGRELVASLIYAGNIASLHGLSLLISNGYTTVAQDVIRLMNLNHCFQRDIVSSLWSKPSDEHEYLEAIAHTGYWAAIGTVSAVVYADRADLKDFAEEFGRHYGRMCQVYDDIREIDDDRRNGYFSLPISIAIKCGYDLDNPEDRQKAIARPKEIALGAFANLQALCTNRFPKLLHLSNRMHETGKRLSST